MFTVEIADIDELQIEMGKAEAELRLRAIIAERRVRELEVELVELRQVVGEADE